VVDKYVTELMLRLSVNCATAHDIYYSCISCVRPGRTLLLCDAQVQSRIA